MRRGTVLSALLVVGLAGGSAAVASPAAPVITVDRTFAKVAGWSIGYSGSLGGCLAAAGYQDGTTIWLGFGGSTDTAFLAFTNLRWRSIEIGQSYEIRIVTRGGGNWSGSFAGFERNGIKGIFTAGLKDQFVSDLANAGGLEVSLEGHRLATLSLVGSADALASVAQCQKQSTTAQNGRELDHGTAPSQSQQQADAETGDDTEANAHREAEGRLRSDRLARDLKAATAALEDASAFVKANGDDDNVLDHLQHITDLKAALSGTEPAPIESGLSTLSAGLAADPLYTAFEARREVEQRRENAHYLEDAVQTLKVQKAFLVHALVQDPTSAQASEFLSLEKQAGQIIAAPDLDRAKTVMGLIDAAITRGGLRASYALARASAEKTAPFDRGVTVAVSPAKGPGSDAVPATDPHQ